MKFPQDSVSPRQFTLLGQELDSLYVTHAIQQAWDRQACV